MPLMHGKSKKSFSHNVGAEMNAGKPRAQALAIAYNVKKKAKGYAHGGEVSESRMGRIKDILAVHRISSGGMSSDSEMPEHEQDADFLSDEEQSAIPNEHMPDPMDEDNPPEGQRRHRLGAILRSIKTRHMKG